MYKINSLKGVIDSHVHIGSEEPPVDGFIQRGLNIKNLTVLARKSGVAFVPKMHFNGLIEPVIEKGVTMIYPSLTFNSKTKGFNQDLVRKVARKVKPARLAVFFPSLEAETHLKNIDEPWFSIFRPKGTATEKQKQKFSEYQEIWRNSKGIKVLDKNGELLLEVKEVIKAVKETGSFFHTSHLGEREINKVAIEAINRGTEIVITHANARANGIKLTTLVELVNLAAKRHTKIWVEFCAANWIVGLRGAYDIKKSFVYWIRVLGVKNCLLSSDGNGLDPDRKNKNTNAFDIPEKIPLKTPLDWLEYFINLLIDKGVNQAEIYQMIVKNPRCLLKVSR